MYRNNRSGINEKSCHHLPSELIGDEHLQKLLIFWINIFESGRALTLQQCIRPMSQNGPPKSPKMRSLHSIYKIEDFRSGKIWSPGSANQSRWMQIMNINNVIKEPTHGYQKLQECVDCVDHIFFSFFSILFGYQMLFPYGLDRSTQTIDLGLTYEAYWVHRNCWECKLHRGRIIWETNTMGRSGVQRRQPHLGMVQCIHPISWRPLCF